MLTSGVEKEQIENVCSIETAGANDICFFYDKKNKALAEKIKAKACVTIQELVQLVPEGVITLVSDNPKLAFINLVSAFMPKQNQKPALKQMLILQKQQRLVKTAISVTGL